MQWRLSAFTSVLYIHMASHSASQPDGTDNLTLYPGDHDKR